MARESKAEKRKRVSKVLMRLKLEYPNAHCALDHSNALELLIATILSAQCTDERVNIVTKALFKKYKTAKDYASAEIEDLENLVKSAGFYRNKAKSIKEMAKILVEVHGGKVPKTMDALIQLPGVGRKTANVVLGNAFGIPSGIVVDTHVGRLSRRLGWTTNQDPVAVETDLVELVDKDKWIIFSHWLIWHGRSICKARSPLCRSCPVVELCPQKGVL